MLRSSCILTIIVANYLAVSVTAQENWPQFRGALSLGVSTNDHLPDHWSATENVAWKIDVTGRVVVVADRVGRQDFHHHGGQPGRGRDAEEGALLRRRPGQAAGGRTSVESGVPRSGDRENVMGAIGPSGAAGHADPFEEQLRRRNARHRRPARVRVLRQRGRVLLRPGRQAAVVKTARAARRAQRLGNGRLAGALPDRVYIVNDNDEDSYLLALNATNGEELFRVKRDEKSNWATPYIWQNSQRVELVTLGTDAQPLLRSRRPAAVGNGGHVDHHDRHALLQGRPALYQLRLRARPEEADLRHPARRLGRHQPGQRPDEQRFRGLVPKGRRSVQSDDPARRRSAVRVVRSRLLCLFRR